jgi:hypothetical protein
MKLWLIKQDVNDGYDTYDSAVVAAPTSSAARHVEVGDKHTWADPEHVTAEHIGEAKRGTQVGVILSSFNAG